MQLGRRQRSVDQGGGPGCRASLPQGPAQGSVQEHRLRRGGGPASGIQAVGAGAVRRRAHVEGRRRNQGSQRLSCLCWGSSSNPSAIPRSTTPKNGPKTNSARTDAKPAPKRGRFHHRCRLRAAVAPTSLHFSLNQSDRLLSPPCRLARGAFLLCRERWPAQLTKRVPGRGTTPPFQASSSHMCSCLCPPGCYRSSLQLLSGIGFSSSACQSPTVQAVSVVTINRRPTLCVLRGWGRRSEDAIGAAVDSCGARPWPSSACCIGDRPHLPQAG